MMGLLAAGHSHAISAMEVPELKHPVDSGDHSASTLYPKGSLAINEASNSRKDSIHTVPGEKVHKDCRCKYCNPDQIAKDTKQEEPTPSTSSDRHVLRSSEGGVLSQLIASSVVDKLNLEGRGRSTMSCKSRPLD